MLFRSNDTATTEIYTTEDTLSLHDALLISSLADPTGAGGVAYMAHIGGFAAGVLAGLLFRALPDRGADPAAFR